MHLNKDVYAVRHCCIALQHPLHYGSLQNHSTDTGRAWELTHFFRHTQVCERVHVSERTNPSAKYASVRVCSGACAFVNACMCACARMRMRTCKCTHAIGRMCMCMLAPGRVLSPPGRPAHQWARPQMSGSCYACLVWHVSLLAAPAAPAAGATATATAAAAAGWVA